MDRLRAETHARHMRVEEQPLFRALAVRDLPLDSYVGFLTALAIVYGGLEQAVLRLPDREAGAIWDEHMRKLPLIERDLAFFKEHTLRPMPAATLHALIMDEQIRRRATDDPLTLLGYLYVLEGSTLGGIVLRAQVARAFKLKDGEGLAYLSSYDRQVKASWKRFTRQMNEAPLDDRTQQRIVIAAGEAFNGIERLVGALYPIPEQEMFELVGVLNPEAGNHFIADDAREIEAAMRAGDRSWRQVPYYEQRYGERGRRFTWSDSSWIVTLAQHSQEVIQHQIDWLGRLLAARGMPRWLLEQHLAVLHAELLQVVPEKRRDYTIFAQEAERLRDQRRAQIDEQTFHALAAAFEQQVGLEWSARLPGIGILIVAAVADEKAGIRHAVSSVEHWLIDPERFPPHWIAAVQATIEQARRHGT